MAIHEHFRQALIDLDAGLCRKVWAHVFPHWPQPETDADALVTKHAARTGMESLDLKHRAYSHRWLTERGMPSALPDHLKPKAERMYPRIVEAVAIAIKTPPARRELGIAIREAMEDVVKDAYGTDKQVDAAKLKIGMMEARAKIRKG